MTKPTEKSIEEMLRDLDAKFMGIEHFLLYDLKGMKEGQYRGCTSDCRNYAFKVKYCLTNFLELRLSKFMPNSVHEDWKVHISVSNVVKIRACSFKLLVMHTHDYLITEGNEI